MLSQSNEGFITKVLRYWFRYVNSCLNIIHVITKLVKIKVYLNRVLISYLLSSDSNSNTKLNILFFPLLNSPAVKNQTAASRVPC